MTVHELSQLVLEWIWAGPKPLHYTLIIVGATVILCTVVNNQINQLWGLELD
jgi:hypothetical protein